MDATMLEAHTSLGVSAEDIAEACVQVPFHPAMLQARLLPFRPVTRSLSE